MLRDGSHRVSTKPHKSRTYGTGQTKHITGTIILNGQVKLPNRRHKDLIDAHVTANGTTLTRRERRKAKLKLRGHFAEAKNVDAKGISPKFTERAQHRRRQAITLPIVLKKAA